MGNCKLTMGCCPSLLNLSTSTQMPRVRRGKRYAPGRKKPYSRRRKPGTTFVRDVSRYEPAVVPLMGMPNGFGFPQQVKVRLRYVDVLTMTSTAGAITKNAFSMNSLYDPDYTGVGHQPYGFDQWGALYQYYTVLGSKLTCHWSPNSQDDNAHPFGPWHVGVVGDDDGSTPGSGVTSAELPRCDSKLLGTKNAGSNIVETVVTYSPQRDLGADPYDDSVGALISASPSKQYYGVAWAQDIPGNTSVLTLKVEIEYVVLFKTAKNQAGS